MIPSQEFKNSLLDNINSFKTRLGNPELDQIQLSLKCCGHTSAEEFWIENKKEELLIENKDGKNKENKDDDNKDEKDKPEDKNDYHLPLTCCEEVDKHRKCKLIFCFKLIFFKLLNHSQNYLNPTFV